MQPFSHLTSRLLKTLLGVLILAVLSVIPPAQAADVDLPSVRLALTQELLTAKTLLAKNQNEQAWQLLSRIVAEDPTNVEVNMLWFQAATRTNRVNQALGALELLVTLHPRDARLRRELANAFALAGDKSSYQAEMDIVKELDSTLYDSNTDLLMERAATAASNRWDRFQLAGRLAAGFIWDNNANKGLDDLNISIGDMNLIMQDGAKKQSALGQYVNANLNGGYHLGDDSPWWLVGDLNLYGKNYYREIPSNQYFGWARAGMGMRHVGTKHIFDVRGKLEHTMYEPVDHATTLGGEVSWIYAPWQSVQFITRGGVESRTYLEQELRNGAYYYAGQYARVLWGSGRSNSAMVGARYLGANTDESRYSYDGWEGSLRLSISPVERLDIAPFAAYREEYYHNAATVLSERLGEDNREDRTWMTGVQFTWHWTEHLATEVGWQYTKSDSNSDFYDYDQHLVNVGLVFSF